MNAAFEEGKRFEKVDFAENSLAQGEYDKCVFVNCSFANVNLTGFKFSNCEFIQCNFSLAILAKTSVQEVKFKNCKLLGLRFDICNPFLFSATFQDCMLNLSSFYKLRLKKTVFKNCSLHEVDFSEADLTQAAFDNCDLALATFEATILEKADFRHAFNYNIDPEKNKIKKAKFSLPAVTGLLNKYDIEIESI